MKNSFLLLVAALACTVPQLAAAVPIHATFNGTVSGSSAFSNLLSDFPIGTAASFSVTFDDAGLVDDAAQVTDYDVAPVSGWLRLGSLEWLFNAGRINTFSYVLGPGHPVISYGLQLTGTGPTISDNGSIFGLFLPLTPMRRRSVVLDRGSASLIRCRTARTSATQISPEFSGLRA